MTNTYETCISHLTNGHDKEPHVVIETSEKTVISALEARPDRFEKVREDNTPGCPRLVWFSIPVDEVNWAGLAKRKGSPRPNLQQAREKAAAA